MTDQAERYDRIAEGYARWWAPVLAPAVDRLSIDWVTTSTAATERVIDVGTGTGQLALGAVERWPTLSVVGIDASGEMCAMADAEADRRLPSAGAVPLSHRGGVRRPPAVRRRDLRPRDLVVRAPARPEPPPGAARDPPGAAAGRGVRIVTWLRGRPRPSSPTGSSTRCSTSSGSSPATPIRAPATSRRSSGPRTSSAGPGSATSTPTPASSSTGSRSRATSRS